jgi:hypothetical protein
MKNVVIALLAAPLLFTAASTQAATTEARCRQLRQYVYFGDVHPESPMAECIRSDGQSCAEIVTSPFGQEWVDGRCWQYFPELEQMVAQ